MRSLGLQNQRLLSRIAQRMLEPSQIDNHKTWERRSSVALTLIASIYRNRQPDGQPVANIGKETPTNATRKQ